MTRDELLALLGSVDSQDAGAATSFVERLVDGDPRLGRSFPGALAAIGYWLAQRDASLGQFLPFTCRQVFCVFERSFPVA